MYKNSNCAALPRIMADKNSAYNAYVARAVSCKKNMP